jgi:hypothetical protein
MANTTNYNWETPDDTDLVKDGAAAIRTLGNSIDTTTKALNPETTLGDIAYRSSTSNTNTRLPIGSNGQILGVSAGVPAWINNDQGDITEVQAGTGISVASGTGPIPVVTNTVATAYDAKGDLVVGTGADTFAKLTVGTNGHILVADSVETTGLKWVAPASSGALTLVKQQTIGSAVASVTVTDAFSATYDNYLIIVSGGTASANQGNTVLTLGSTTANYYMSGTYFALNSSTVNGFNVNNGSGWTGTYFSTTGHSGHINLQDPFATKRTVFNSQLIGVEATSYFANYGGFLNNTTSYTAFTLSAAGGNNITGGEIRVYGYQNS